MHKYLAYVVGAHEALAPAFVVGDGQELARLARLGHEPRVAARVGAGAEPDVLDLDDGGGRVLSRKVGGDGGGGRGKGLEKLVDVEEADPPAQRALQS